ncbi:MAG: GyrI-like domain-containing protein [Anaerolineae bacterium]|jgi:AraC family transcriptional regulator|nr:GyrI-like domain-containing protein [Anaerolineae bacterium]
MVNFRIVEKPAFDVVGPTVWIGGQDNELFGQFWTQCEENGVLSALHSLNDGRIGSQTGSVILGVSRVEAAPNNRQFYYMIAREVTDANPLPEGMEHYRVPPCTWAVFECHGKVPEAIVKSEMFAFMEWLPQSGYQHAPAPEMEVYFPDSDGNTDDCYTEFWLPVVERQLEEL